jgi:hypothetical protein
MSDITKEEKAARKNLLGKCYTYLCDNFHKFNETNKIRIALELVKKSMPQDVNHGGQPDNPINVSWKVDGHRNIITPQSMAGMGGSEESPVQDTGSGQKVWKDDISDQ